MKLRTMLSVVLTLCLLQGCMYKVVYDAATDKGDFYPVKTVDTAYEPATQARIRILSGYITKDSQCYGDNPVSLGQRAWSMLKMSQVMHTGVVGESVSIGMPRSTEKNRSIFTEEVVAAGQPVAIRAWLDYSSIDPGTKIETKVKCFPPGISFVPVMGRDYEMVLRRNGDKCWVDVYPLDAAGTHVAASLIPITVAPVCPVSP
jgi:hypothetical protein